MVPVLLAGASIHAEVLTLAPAVHSDLLAFVAAQRAPYDLSGGSMAALAGDLPGSRLPVHSRLHAPPCDTHGCAQSTHT
jgi:hypothetical protein